MIVSTSVGAADPQLLAACGIYAEEDDDNLKADKETSVTSSFGTIREWAPDNLPPLSLPFVIIDEACQSVEPATLIPIVSANSCRSLVMLGDPCQVSPFRFFSSLLRVNQYSLGTIINSYHQLSEAIHLLLEHHNSLFLSCHGCQQFQSFTLSQSRPRKTNLQ